MKTQIIPGVAQLDELDLPTAHFIRLEGEVVWVRYKNVKEEITVAEARKHTEALKQLNGGKPLHIILDFRGIFVTFSNESRAYFAKSADHALLRKSQAMILGNLAQRIVANFYLRFNKPSCPAKVVSSPEEAIIWFKNLDEEGRLIGS